MAHTFNWSARSTDDLSGKALREFIGTFEKCIVESGTSFLWKASYPATNEVELATRCKTQADAMKCVKDKIKSGFPSILKRGINTYLQNLQKITKKYCNNVNSEISRKYTSDMKCIMTKKLDAISQLEGILGNKAIEIARRNYNDSAVELKQICCSLFTHKQSILEALGSDCPESKATLEEYINQQVNSEVELVCGDEEKLLTTVCPKLEKLEVSSKFDPEKDANSAGLFIYLVGTLGEPETAS